MDTDSPSTDDADTSKILIRAVEQTGRIISGMGVGQLSLSTPCTEWNVRDVVNHLISSLHMFSQGAMGAKFNLEEFGVDRVKYDAAVSYAQEAAKLKIALGRAGVMDQEWDLAFGSPEGSLAVDIAIIEFVAHGWDIARATNSKVELDPELAEVALANARMLTTQFGRQEGVFADELPPPEGADAYQRLAAFVGRDPLAVLR
jgi:uncharacterized protein (TIGR03086 family)